ncbi:MAG: hypothetical protein HS113_23170 [Verrucomicrobiales bacterium]|nr:hypothetical protein [Verrucomicrobiales bacterium]
MKRTDREKDWPIVRGLGHQLWERGDVRCLLHLARPEALLAAWHALPRSACEAMAVRRPLLRVLERTPAPTRLDLERLVALERLVWERVNQQRQGRYTSAWKSFYRQWRQEEEWEWPVNEPFDRQHGRLLQAARRHGLPPNPLADVRPEALVQAAVHEVAGIDAATETEMAQVLPPTGALLP